VAIRDVIDGGIGRISSFDKLIELNQRLKQKKNERIEDSESEEEDDPDILPAPTKFYKS